MPDRRTPFVNTSERDTLVDFLDYLRDSVVIKSSGLSHEDVRRAMVPSGTSLLGLAKHLTSVEVSWFQWSFAGLDVPIPSSTLEQPDTEVSVIAGYRAATERSNEIVGAETDLSKLCTRTGHAFEPLSLRWVLVHMVEETARHAGHADILREQLDGQIGR
jgi:hypothetical protein